MRSHPLETKKDALPQGGHAKLVNPFSYFPSLATDSPHPEDLAQNNLKVLAAALQLIAQVLDQTQLAPTDKNAAFPVKPEGPGSLGGYVGVGGGVLKSTSQPPGGSGGVSYVAAVNDCLVDKARQGVRERSLIQYRSTLSLFYRHLGQDWPLARISRQMIENWIHGPHHGKMLAPRTKRTYLTDLRTFFNWCVRRELLTASPVAGVARPLLEDRPVCIHAPEEVQRILGQAWGQDRDVMRVLAIQYFAGIRPAEVARLSEANILAEFIEVPGLKAKTRQRRLVKISATLRAWLEAGGQLPVVNLTKRFRKVRAAAGVAWGHDVCRHTFASYHLAAHRNQDETAFELGHRSTQMLFAHYRELVPPLQAAQFWSLRPPVTVTLPPQQASKAN